MKHRNLVLLLAIFAIFTLVLGACADDPEPEQPDETPDETPDKSERFPCEGKWCFDEENQTVRDLLEENTGVWEDEILEIYSEAYAACNYTEDERGMVTVKCPQWAQDSLLTQCPQNWFQILTFVGSIRGTAEEGNEIYCFPETDPSIALRNEFFCTGGYVNPGHAASSFEDRVAGKASGASCLRAEDCATLEALRWPSKEKSCFYSDFSHISEGAPEDVDCDTLAEGECSINCQCPRLANDPTGWKTSCNHLSSTRSVGVCGYHSCREDRWCTLEGVVKGKCLEVRELPEWAQSYYDGMGEKAGIPRRWGMCVQPDHYENWRGKDDVFFKYGD